MMRAPPDLRQKPVSALPPGFPLRPSLPVVARRGTSRPSGVAKMGREEAEAVAWRFPLTARLHGNADRRRDAHAGIGRLHPTGRVGWPATRWSARTTERLAFDHLRVPSRALCRRGSCRGVAHARAAREPRARRRCHARRGSRDRSLARSERPTSRSRAPMGRCSRSSAPTKGDGSLLAAWQSLRTEPLRAAACVGLDEPRSTFAPCGFGGDLRPQATIQLHGDAARRSGADSDLHRRPRAGFLLDRRVRSRARSSTGGPSSPARASRRSIRAPRPRIR